MGGGGAMFSSLATNVWLLPVMCSVVQCCLFSARRIIDATSFEYVHYITSKMNFVAILIIIYVNARHRCKTEGRCV